MAATTHGKSELGRRLRSEREGRGWSRLALSAKSGVSEPTIARIELYGSEPTLGTLTALASALGLSLSALLPSDNNGGEAA